MSHNYFSGIDVHEGVIFGLAPYRGGAGHEGTGAEKFSILFKVTKKFHDDFWHQWVFSRHFGKDLAIDLLNFEEWDNILLMTKNKISYLRLAKNQGGDEISWESL